MHTLDFEPGFCEFGAVGRIGSLGDDAFVIQLGGVFEQLLSIAEQVFAVESRRFKCVGIEQLFQKPFAFALRLLAEVLAVEPQEVESEINQAILVASGEIGL